MGLKAQEFGGASGVESVEGVLVYAQNGIGIGFKCVGLFWVKRSSEPAVSGGVRIKQLGTRRRRRRKESGRVPVVVGGIDGWLLMLFHVNYVSLLA